MEIFSILFLICSVVLIIISINNIKKANKITIQKNYEIAEYEKKVVELEQIQFRIEELKNEKIKILQDIEEEKNKIDGIYDKETKKIDKQIETYKNNLSYCQEQYLYSLEKKYTEEEKKFDDNINHLNKEKEKIENDLQKIKNTFAASVQAKLREEEKENHIDYYTLQTSQKDSYEINAIKSIESLLSDPRPVRMLIWTTYYSKKANELCSRVLGKDKVMGIYKITNIENNAAYVGQAKDVKERWREHMKCGLGIDTPAGNKLYAAMKEKGLESFSFELLEECSVAELNEKEKFYIDLFSSYDFGYNSNRGVNK